MSDSEQRLIQAVDRYLQSIEEGQPLSAEQLRNDYPDIASELNDCLSSLKFLGKANAEIQGGRSDPKLQDHAAVEDPLIETTLGDYQLKKQIGRGGMGVVYDAEQLALQRRVAVKVLPFASALDAQRLQRFRHEAMSAAALHHAHIVPVFLVGHENGIHFYVMQLVEGQSLAELLRRTSKPAPNHSSNDSVDDHEPPEEQTRVDETDEIAQALTQSGNDRQGSHFRKIARLFAPVADALEHAHDAGIVHRDVKPSNLLLDQNGKLWLTDFGLAMRADTHGLTMTGDVVGTLKYMSPEQVLGNRATVDHRSDVYSLGLSLYELVAQRPAFDSANRATLVQQISNSTLPSLKSVNSAIPVDLRVIVEKAIASDPADRYQTAAAFAKDLRKFADDQPIAARRPTITRRLQRFALRHHRAVVSGVIAVLLMVGALIVGNITLAQEQERTEEALADSQELIVEYQGALQDFASIINQHQLYDEPAYQAMIRDFAQTLSDRSQLLHSVANNDDDVRATLIFNLLSVGRAASESGNADTARSVFKQLQWLARRDVTVARERFAEEKSAKALNRLVKALDAYSRSERYCNDLGSNGAELNAEALRQAELGTEKFPEDRGLWYWKGRLLTWKADAYEKDESVREEYYRESVNAFRTSLQKVEWDPTWYRLAATLGQIHTMKFQIETTAEALEISAERVKIMARLCENAFTLQNVETYCRVLSVHATDVARSRRYKSLAEVNDEHLRVARKGYEKFRTTNLRREVISAITARLRDLSLGTRDADPVALMREARRLAYVGDRKVTGRRLFGLATISNAYIHEALSDEDTPAPKRLDAFRELVTTLRVTFDIRDDLEPAGDFGEKLIEGYYENNAHLQKLLEEEAKAEAKAEEAEKKAKPDE